MAGAVAGELAQYEGYYTAERISAYDQVEFRELQLTARSDGTLQNALVGTDTEQVLTFYADDYVVDRSSGTATSGMRANFLCDEGGAIAWLRSGGRLNRPVGPQRQEPSTSTATLKDELIPDFG